MEQPDATPSDEEGRGYVGGRNLPLAIGVGVALVAVFLGSIFWHPLAFTAVIAVLTVLAYLEADRVLREVGERIDAPVLIVSTLVMLFGAYQARQAGQTIGVLVLFVGAVVWLLTDSRRQQVTRRLAVTVFFGLWVGLLASYGVLLINRPAIGPLVVLAVVGAAILTDIGGYAFGVTLGRRPLAPSISPSKTWEGLLGGVVVAMVAATLVLPLLEPAFSPLDAGLLALACGLASALGDLVESMVKRDLGVKDLGALLPGHGGVLDRVDGILFALPVGFYAVELLLR